MAVPPQGKTATNNPIQTNYPQGRSNQATGTNRLCERGGCAASVAACATNEPHAEIGGGAIAAGRDAHTGAGDGSQTPRAGPAVSGQRPGTQSDPADERTQRTQNTGVNDSADRGSAPEGGQMESTHRSRGRIKLASLNMRGAGLPTNRIPDDKWARINQIMRTHRIAVLAVQEAHLTQESTRTLNELFENSLLIISSPDPTAPTAARGVAFVVNKKLMATEQGLSHRTLIPGRAAELTLSWGAKSKINIVNVYAPNSANENAIFWNEVAGTLRRQGGRGPDVLLGDCNLVECPEDRAPARPDPALPCESLANMRLGFDLIDGWRAVNPTRRAFTFLQSSTGSQSRIDRIYISARLEKKAADWSISESGVRTDHQLVSVTLANYNDPYIGPGRWVIPKAVMEDREFIAEAVEAGRLALEAISRTATGNPRTGAQELYSLYKDNMRDLARRRVKALYAKWDRKISAVKEQIGNLLKEDIDSGERGAANRETIALLKKSLENLEVRRFEKDRNDMRTRQWLDGERMNCFWLSQGKERTRKEPCYELRRTGGETPGRATTSKLMAALAKEHYDSIQDDNEHEMENHAYNVEEALSSLEAKLNSRQKGHLGERLTLNEVRNAVLGAATRKAAGLDGLTAEFWQTLDRQWVKDVRAQRPAFNVAEMMTIVFNDIERNGLMDGSTLTDGWICPIYKLKGDPREISNYRPITVLNADYKFMTKALSVKLAAVASSIIHEDQAGFISGRRIHDNIKLTQLIAAFAETEGLGGAIIALDQEKAYDKINHSYLWTALRRMNFPERFINTVGALYTSARSAVMINGVISPFFTIRRGVRQGDPLSCLLFNLAIEPLACALRKSDICGFRIPGVDERLVSTMFADDTTVFLKAPDSYRGMTAILDKWCLGARASFNKPKTVIIPVGPKAARDNLRATRTLSDAADAIPVDVKILDEGDFTRILGAWIGPCGEDPAPWKRITETIKHNLGRWEKRRPTLKGRQLIVNLEVGSRTQYLARVQGMPKAVEDSLAKLVTGFIWGDASPAIARATLERPVKEGGLRLLDVKARNEAIHLMWLRSYLDLSPSRPKWAFVADALMARAILATERRVDPKARVNTFLQHWSVNTSVTARLPRDLAQMTRVAKKYGVRLDAMRPRNSLIDALPAWYHFALVNGKSMANSKSGKCLRDKHDVDTVADCLAIERKPTGTDRHREHRDCECTQCRHDREYRGCDDPARCARMAKNILSRLREKWRPDTVDTDDRLSLTKNRHDQNMRNETTKDALTFDPSITQGAPVGGALRIFVPADAEEAAGARRLPPPFQVTDEKVVAYTDGSCCDNGSTKAAAGAGVWFGPDSNRNAAARVPGGCQSNQAAEAYAVLLAAEGTPDFAPLTIVTDSTYVYKGLTRHLRGWEDRGWVGVANASILMRVIARLRRRSAPTVLEWVKGHSGVEGNEQADRLAALGAERQVWDLPRMSEQEQRFLLPGVRLATLTQKLAYRCIQNSKAREDRPRTAVSTAMIQEALQADFNLWPTTEALWADIWGKDMPVKISVFFWKSVHGAYRVGSFWANVPGYEARATCATCGVEDSMDHILRECTAPGQRDLWGLALSTMRRAGVELPQMSLGATFGAPSLKIEGREGTMAGKTRLTKIILTETIYMIWKARCERVIAWEQEPGRTHSAQALERMWCTAINERLRMDIDRTRKRWKQKRLPPKLVLETWRGTLHDEAALPEDWTETKGVLVGTLSEGDRHRTG